MDYYIWLAHAYFVDDSTYKLLELAISYYNNCLYNLYKSINIENDSIVPKWYWIWF